MSGGGNLKPGNPATAAALGAHQKVANLRRGLADMADDLGYVPGEFVLARLAEDIATARLWLEDLGRDVVPVDFTGQDIDEVRVTVTALIQDIEERDQNWRDYFYPKLRAVDSTVSGPDEGPVGVTVNFVRPGEAG